jgi:thioredoxin reductase
MSNKYYDIIIIGSGMSGLYSAYNIQKISPNTSFLILEKHKKQWMGGRTSNETFYGTQIVTGAGVGRKDKNPLLIKLMDDIGIKYTEFDSIMNYSKLFTPVDIVKIINQLKKEYVKHPELHNKTFKQFFLIFFDNKLYKQFIISAGYTDYENADLYETLYNYGMDDNKSGWTGLYIPWKNMVDKLYHIIGKEHFKFSNDVINIQKIDSKPCLFKITTQNGDIYNCNKVIVATTITGIQKLVPGASSKNSLYQQIHGQPFLRLYAKFDRASANIMKKYVTDYTIVPGPLQKIIPMDANKGVYMIAYSDNSNALIQKDYLKDTAENRNLYCDLLEESLGIPENSLKIIALKDFYWPIGTHYYGVLKGPYRTRNEFVYKAQHPENGIIIVGEVVSRYTGWTEGALQSVKAVLTKNWVKDEC